MSCLGFLENIETNMKRLMKLTCADKKIFINMEITGTMGTPGQEKPGGSA